MHAENSILQGNSAGGCMVVVVVVCIYCMQLTLTSTTFADRGNYCNYIHLHGGEVVVVLYMEIAVRSLCDRAVSSPTQHHMVMQYIHTTHQQ